MVEIDGQPWFLATDCYQLLYGRTTGISVRNYISEDEVRMLLKASAPAALSSLFSGTRYRLALLAESALYKLVMRSDKPEAKDFQNWITRVVLPAIRKDGGYIHGEENVVSQRHVAGVMTEDELVFERRALGRPIVQSFFPRSQFAPPWQLCEQQKDFHVLQVPEPLALPRLDRKRAILPPVEQFRMWNKYLK
ncbi:BRO-N domain-containing protein [Sinorhizobium meliloti]|uniref:BRO-N domain-containing protein n=1 Tax=Rhizobium meliloti TaxID=382 RepID=UPI0013E33423|nr:BRO family protein [Sinorhizobium meliloti]